MDTKATYDELERFENASLFFGGSRIERRISAAYEVLDEQTKKPVKMIIHYRTVRMLQTRRKRPLLHRTIIYAEARVINGDNLRTFESKTRKHRPIIVRFGPPKEVRDEQQTLAA